MLKPPCSPKKVDDWGIRFPTLVDDVAQCLKLIIDSKREDKSRVTGVLHCSSPEATTKYQLVLMMARVLGISDTSHLTPDGEPPAGAPRPRNTQLECSETWQKLGKEVQFTPLCEGIAKAIQPFQELFSSASNAEVASDRPGKAARTD